MWFLMSDNFYTEYNGSYLCWYSKHRPNEAIRDALDVFMDWDNEVNRAVKAQWQNYQFFGPKALTGVPYQRWLAYNKTQIPGFTENISLYYATSVRRERRLFWDYEKYKNKPFKLGDINITADWSSDASFINSFKMGFKAIRKLHSAQKLRRRKRYHKVFVEPILREMENKDNDDTESDDNDADDESSEESDGNRNKNRNKNRNRNRKKRVIRGNKTFRFTIEGGSEIDDGDDDFEPPSTKLVLENSNSKIPIEIDSEEEDIQPVIQGFDRIDIIDLINSDSDRESSQHEEKEKQQMKPEYVDLTEDRGDNKDDDGDGDVDGDGEDDDGDEDIDADNDIHGAGAHRDILDTRIVLPVPIEDIGGDNDDDGDGGARSVSISISQLGSCPPALNKPLQKPKRRIVKARRRFTKSPHKSSQSRPIPRPKPKPKPKPKPVCINIFFDLTQNWLN